jgi:hypothetical protein
MRFLLLWTAAAGLLAAADKYTVYESEHFELITDGGRSRAESILTQFERVRAFFVKNLLSRDPLLKPRIVVFHREKDYRAIAPSEVAAAHYANLPQRDYIAIGTRTGDEDSRVAIHEYVHLLVQHLDTPMPVWMNEGIAELYSNIQQVGDVVRVGTPIPRLVFEARENSLAVPALVGADHGSPLYNRRKHAGPFYATSWALVHMLSLDPAYKNGFKPLAQALADGEAPEQAFPRIFQKTPEEIEAALKRYLRANSIHVVDVPMRWRESDQKVAPREVTGYEWGVAIADLQVAARQFPKAVERLEALTRETDKRPEAWESLAFARWMQKDASSGEAFLNARQRGSSNGQLALWSTALTKDAMASRTALEELVSAHPEFVPGRIRLAEAQMRDGDDEAAFGTISRVKRISARVLDGYFTAYIQAAWRSGHVEEARTSSAQYTSTARTPQSKQQAERLRVLAMRDRGTRKAAPVEAALAAPPSTTAADDEPVRIRRRKREELTLIETQRPEDFGFDEDPAVLRMGRKALTEIEGTLVRVDCREPVLLTVKTESGETGLSIDEPNALAVVNSADGRGELTCGEQARKIRIGYYPKEGLDRGAAGVVRKIEFLP